MTYMNKNYGTLPVTAEQLLDIKTAQAEETVPEPQYQFSVIKFNLAIVTPIVSMYLMALISIIFKTEPSDMIYIMLLTNTYVVFAGCFLTNIYGDAKVNPLRSIRVRALEASYYMGLLIVSLFNVLGQFPHTKHVIIWYVRCGIVMLIAALIFIFNGCGVLETMNVLFLISDLSMTLGPDSGRDYSTDYGMFHFCIVDSEHDWREGSEQCAWIEKCLISVDRQKQPWLIFSANRVLGYSSKSWLTSKSVIGVVVAINDIVLFQGGAVKEVRSIVIDDPE
ncbi:nucleotide pyrophosphatase/phosphodiesterase-like protein, partial [Tanacetum coccineum]